MEEKIRRLMERNRIRSLQDGTATREELEAALLELAQDQADLEAALVELAEMMGG